MKNFQPVFRILIILLGHSFQCFAVQQNHKTASEQLQISDNYYLQSGEVYIAPHGKIFVLSDGEPIQVNILCSDEKGIFVPGREMNRCK